MRQPHQDEETLRNFTNRFAQYVAGMALRTQHPVPDQGHQSDSGLDLSGLHDVRSTRLQVDTFVVACEFVACNFRCAVVLERFAENAIEMGRPISYVGKRVQLGQPHYLADNKSAKQIDPVIEAFKTWLRTLFAT